MSNPATPGSKTLALSLLCLSLLCALAPLAAAAQNLPATAPTAMPAPLAVTAPAVTARRPHRAEVVFNNDLLTVRANDSSLHQILSSISRITGMKITGGVEDQRVFGNYGPDNASTILATLLDGTGVNMLIREDDGHRPTELALTPRSGGSAAAITPQDEDLGSDTPVPPAALQATPLPQAIRSAAPGQMQTSAQPVSRPLPQPVAEPGSSGPPVMPQPLNNPLGDPSNVTPTASQIPTTNSVPTDSLPTPSTAAPAVQGIVDTPNPPPAGSTTPVTPDQIYQKLLQMQKAKAAQNTGAAPQ